MHVVVVRVAGLDTVFPLAFAFAMPTHLDFASLLLSVGRDSEIVRAIARQRGRELQMSVWRDGDRRTNDVPRSAIGAAAVVANTLGVGLVTRNTQQK